MKNESSGSAISEIGLEAQAHAAKGEFRPGYIGLRKQGGLKAFCAGGKVGIEQSSAVKQVYLTDVGQIDQCEQVVDFDACAGFLGGFTHGRLRRGFAVFHETSWQCPKPVAWFNSATTQQNIALPLDNAADNQLWIQVVNCGADRAYMTRKGVAGRDDEFNGGATLRAVVHGRILYDKGFCRMVTAVSG